MPIGGHFVEVFTSRKVKSRPVYPVTKIVSYFSKNYTILVGLKREGEEDTDRQVNLMQPAKTLPSPTP